MKRQILPFEADFLEEAGRLLDERQLPIAGTGGSPVDQGRDSLRKLLDKEDVISLAIKEEGRLTGFCFSRLEESRFFGKSAYAGPDCWLMSSLPKDAFLALYASLAPELMKKNCREHIFRVYHNDKEGFNALVEAGFAKVQTYAVLHLEEWTSDLSSAGKSAQGFTLRKAPPGDRKGLSRFSRLIAGYQAKAPCYAHAPQGYLAALDEGFIELENDDEALVYLLETKGKIAGYQVYYPDDDLAPGGWELSVAGIAEEFRGLGGGRFLTDFALADLQDKGVPHILTDWRCANPLSAPFWIKTGFRPVSHRMVRIIDPRIN